MARDRVRGHLGRDRLRRRGRSTIRVGAGGVMLPNHAPLVIAEQFGTLEALYPGRIDLGLGRAPGTDQPTMRALRRDFTSAERSRRTSRSCRRCSATRRPTSTSRPCRARARTSRCGFSTRRCSAPSSPPRSGLPYAFVAPRARRARARDPGLPRALPAFRAARPAVRDAGGQRDHRRHRPSGAHARHLAAEVLHRRRVPAQAHAAAAADRQHRRTGTRRRRRSWSRC